MVRLNVAPSSSTNWGADLLGVEVMANGESAEVTFPAGGECLFDIRATFEDGAATELRQVNLCETAHVTINRGAAAACGAAGTRAGRMGLKDRDQYSATTL